jgi:hypothetical protein
MIETDDIDRMLVIPCLEERRDLGGYLEQIWSAYFADTPRVNEVTIGYCYPWKSRLGLIRLSLDHCISFIGVNALLQSPLIPECVVLVTIAHELAHYAHGFGSPLPRACLHPHANQVIERELERRELGAQMRCCNEWIDKNWLSFYHRQREMGWAGFYGICSVSALS